MMTSSAICSDGAWLNGLSKPPSTSNMKPGRPLSGPRETGGERESEEASHGDGLRGEIARGQAVDARLGGVEEQRQRVEGVDRPVGNDRPGEERHRPFPIVDDAADMVALRSRPIGEAVGQVEHRRQEGEPQRGALGDDGEGCVSCGPRRSRCLAGFSWAEATRQKSTHHAHHILSATDTVKMPNSSMRWSILRKPAFSTS